MTASSTCPANGVYRVGPAARRRARKLAQRARTRGFALFTLDLAPVGSKSAFLRCAAEALSFPDYFGANWDAFYDCVTDFAWRPAPGYLLELRHTQALARRAPTTLATALEVLAEAAEFWRQQRVPFLILVDDPEAPAFSRGTTSL
jgi:RNAse (barnase) inhibitor barstar